MIIGFLIVAATTAYGLHHLAKPKTASVITFPVYESYLSHGTEAKIKEIDRSICDALLALGVPAENVIFKSVEPRTDGQEEWSYSDLEVWLVEVMPLKDITATLSRKLATAIPQETPTFILKPDGNAILEISVNGRPTHRLTFVAPHEIKTLPLPLPTLPQVAIIIDDLGYDQKVAAKFLEIDALLSFSVLPHSPFQQAIAAAIHESGRDVLLHLPLEPMEYPNANPGEGALMSAMTQEELLNQLREDLDCVPYVIGVNNHMGSRLTQDSEKMRQILTTLKHRDLFFVDSLTSPRSCCADVAQLLNLKFARRQVFLDNTQDPDAIRFQIKRLISVAKKQGQAIGIAHPYPVTLEVLQQEIANIEQEIELVPVSELLG